MTLRKSNVFLGGTAVLVLFFATLLVHSRLSVESSRAALSRKAQLVRTLELTDLCLFTEATYTRHLAMTDLSTPFQDSPASLDHFPTGALAGPPSHVARSHARND